MINLRDMIKTVGDLRKFFDKIGDDTPLSVVELDEMEWIMIVDSKGGVRKTTRQKSRSLFVHIDLPLT